MLASSFTASPTATWSPGSVPPPELDLGPPLTCGDYRQPDTQPINDPFMQAPPLVPLERYEVAVFTPPERNDASLTRFQSFYLNPDPAGAPAPSQETAFDRPAG